MKHLLNVLVVVMLLGILVVAPSPPITSASTDAQNLGAARVDPRLEAALKLLEDKNPAGVGGQLAQTARSNATAILFFPFVGTKLEGNEAVFLAVDGSAFILVDSRYIGGPDEALATLLGHESKHLSEWLASPALVNTFLGCLLTEVDAFRTHTLVWEDLRKSLVDNTPALQRAPADFLENERTLMNELVQGSPNADVLGANIIGIIEQRYVGTQCSGELVLRDVINSVEAQLRGTLPTITPSQSSGSVGTSGTTSSTGTTPTTPTRTTGSSGSSNTDTGSNPSNSPTGSTSASVVAGVTVEATNNPSGDGNSGNPSDLPSSLPKSGGFPVDGSGLALVAAVLTGVGIGLRRIIS